MAFRSINTLTFRHLQINYTKEMQCLLMGSYFSIKNHVYSRTEYYCQTKGVFKVLNLSNNDLGLCNQSSSIQLRIKLI